MANGTVLTVQFVAPNSDPDAVRAAQQITTSMQAVGLKVNLVITDYNTVVNEKYTIPDTYYVVLFPDSYFPSPFKWMRNPVNLPSAFRSSNTTFVTDFAAALSNPVPSAALAELKTALNVLANAAVTNSVFYEPAEVAYNTAQFSNWQPALNNAGNFDVFYYPVLSEQVLTSVQPISVGSSTSTTSAASSSSSSSTAISTPMALGMAGVAIFIAVVYVTTIARKSSRVPGNLSAT